MIRHDAVGQNLYSTKVSDLPNLIPQNLLFPNSIQKKICPYYPRNAVINRPNTRCFHSPASHEHNINSRNSLRSINK